MKDRFSDVPRSHRRLSRATDDVIDIEVVFTSGAKRVTQTRSRIEPYNVVTGRSIPDCRSVGVRNRASR